MRKWIFAMCLMPVAAFAGPREDVYAASQRCAGISDNRDWLNCYYGAAQAMRQDLHLPPAPAAQTALVPGGVPSQEMPRAAMATPVPQMAPQMAPMSQAGRRQTGLFGGTLAANVALSAYRFDQKKHFIITLANGEVWQQAASDTNMANWTKPPAFYTVAIRQSGQVNVLEISGDSTPYRVERVR